MAALNFNIKVSFTKSIIFMKDSDWMVLLSWPTIASNHHFLRKKLSTIWSRINMSMFAKDPFSIFYVYSGVNSIGWWITFSTLIWSLLNQISAKFSLLTFSLGTSNASSLFFMPSTFMLKKIFCNFNSPINFI